MGVKTIQEVNSDVLNNLVTCVMNGSNKISQQFTSQEIIIDEQFIEEVSRMLYSIEAIVKNPKRFIKNNQMVVNVERAKKINAESVRHLASHTNFIRCVNPDGTVQPSKVLSNEMEEDLALYENRFVFTLIKKLSAFIEQRYKLISENSINKDITRLNYNSDFKVGKAVINCNMSLQLKVPCKDKKLLEKNTELLDELEEIRKRIMIIRGSEFYIALKDSKPVLPPIQKTNIITMHKDYKQAYNLWLFIASYSSLGYSVKVKQKDVKITNSYYEDLANIVGETAKLLIQNDTTHAESYGEQVAEQRDKTYSVAKSVDYVPEFSLSGNESKEELFNQFYYDKVKEIIYKKIGKIGIPSLTEEQNDISNSDDNNAEDVDDKVARKKKQNLDSKAFDMTFGKFYRNLSSVNKEMMDELLNQNLYKPERFKDNKVKEIEEEIKLQNQVVKRYRIMSSLKSQELDKMLRKETNQIIKLEKLKYKLADAQGVLERKKARLEKQKQKNLNKTKMKQVIIENRAMRERRDLLRREAMHHKTDVVKDDKKIN